MNTELPKSSSLDRQRRSKARSGRSDASRSSRSPILNSVTAGQQGRSPASQWARSPVNQRARSLASQRGRSPASQRVRSPDSQRGRSPASQRARSPVSQRGRSPASQQGRSPRCRVIESEYSHGGHRERSCASKGEHSPVSQRERSQREDTHASYHRRHSVSQSKHASTRQRSRTRERSPLHQSKPVSGTHSDNNSTLLQLVQALNSLGHNTSTDKLSFQNSIPEFDPSRKEQTIDMWLHKVNECLVIYSWTDKQTIHFSLPKLKGLAQKWYEGLTTVMYSWPEWQEKLRLAFPSDENYGQLLTTMLNKRAKFNDSLEEYFYEKVILLNRCGIQGKRAVDCIIFGIEDRSVRLGAEAARFDSPDQLLPYLKSAKNIGSLNSNFDKKRNRPSDTKLDRGHGKKETRGHLIQCFNCSQYGHYKSQCTKPLIKCIKCSRYGHTADTCNDSKYNERKLDNSQPKPYHKQALVNGVPKSCFVDFGSAATLVRVSDVADVGASWEYDQTLPSLRGFGNTVVQPLGKCSVNIEIDEAKARVILLVVPDHFLNEALGSSFTSTNFKTFLDGLGVKHVLNAVATPRANGQVERYNRTLLDALTAKLDKMKPWLIYNRSEEDSASCSDNSDGD
ncbi:hypothetical protein ABMA27_003621 [Loxostege sticticalis]|uniref:Uncharacterized protein n=1 Tax=Loxostege sticticalis TaxID=481309 RepID=A0ABR3HPN6_LOXSC